MVDKCCFPLDSSLNQRPLVGAYLDRHSATTQCSLNVFFVTNEVILNLLNSIADWSQQQSSNQSNQQQQSGGVFAKSNYSSVIGDRSDRGVHKPMSK